jgi:hypothetical protein
MNRLDSLKKNLEKINLEEDSNRIHLLKLSLMGPSPQKIKEYQTKETPEHIKETWHVILDLLGLAPGVGEFADLINAGTYLAEGANPKTLFNAGVSIVSMITGLGDSSKILKYVGKAYNVTDLKVLEPIARRIINNADNIKAVFSRLKSTEVKKRLQNVPNGELLIKYSDAMANVVLSWAKNLLRNTAGDGLNALIREG